MSIGYLKKLIEDSSRITAFTGAGISTGSGIPDYRGPEGIWTKNPQLENLFTLQNYMNDPDIRKTFWERRGIEGGANYKPNDGHKALAKLYEMGKLKKIVTQNVDGLHQASGVADEDVVEVHGTTRTSSCVNCGHRVKTRGIYDKLDLGQAAEDVINCYECAYGFYKQDAIFFGEMLSDIVYAEAIGAVTTSSLLLVIGTSLQVSPVNELVAMADNHYIPFVIINRDPTDFDPYAEAVIRHDISEVLTEVVG